MGAKIDAHERKLLTSIQSTVHEVNPKMIENTIMSHQDERIIYQTVKIRIYE
jgi:hypothetical protein